MTSVAAVVVVVAAAAAAAAVDCEERTIGSVDRQTDGGQQTQTADICTSI